MGIAENRTGIVLMCHKETFFNIRCDFLICLFLIISILAVYGQTGNYEFVNYDDPDYILENPHVRTGLTSESIIWAFTATHASNWHPLTWLSHILDVHLYGMNPGQHHLTNVLFHIANAVLLFLVLSRMTGKLWKSGFVAALFALHPLHAESVAWVSERKDVLCTFFWMLTMQSYLRYVEYPGIKRYLPALFCFALGLMAKPMLVTLPFVLILLDYWPLERIKIETGRLSEDGGFNLRSSIFEKTPFFILVIASGIITLVAQKSGGALVSLENYPLHVRIANAVVSYASYIGKMVWPHHLAVYYPHPGEMPWWKVGGAFALLAAITLLAVRNMRSHPWLAVGWLEKRIIRWKSTTKENLG